jgi:O-antigen/teichoic acid export membrane protein
MACQPEAYSIPAQPTAIGGLRPWAAWLGKGTLATLDQGLISGSNFALGILLARWLAPQQYGAYALAFAIFLLLSQIYQSLVLEPMSVFGGSIFRKQLPAYLGALVWMHTAIAAVIALVLGTWALLAHVLGQGRGLPAALAAVTVAAPFILLFWLVRRGFYLRLSPAPAAAGAALYCVIVLSGTYVAWRQEWLSAFVAFLLMAIGALATSAVLLISIKPAFSQSMPTLREAWGEHWVYGRWALLSSFAMWLPSNIYFLLLDSFFGLSQTGELRALVNLALPAGQTATALTLLFQTHASYVHHEHGAAGVKKLTAKITQLYVAGAIVYWAVMVPLRHQTVHLLYGGRYAGVASLVPWLALSSMLQIAVNGPGIGLRAMEFPASVFVAYSASSVVALLVGVPLTWAFGVRGAVGALLVSQLVSFCVMSRLLGRKVQAGMAMAA